jgi:hypothetical protein
MANRAPQISGVAGPSFRPKKPAPQSGSTMAVTTSQPMPANPSARYCERQRRLASAHAEPSTPKPTTIATISPSSSTTLPACWSVSIRKPKTKPGITASSGWLSS